MKYLVITNKRGNNYFGYYIVGEPGNYNIEPCNISAIQSIPPDVVKANFTKSNEGYRLVCAETKLKYKVTVTALAEIRTNSAQGKIAAYDVFISDTQNVQVARLSLDKLESLYTSFQTFGNGVFTNLSYVENSYFRLYPNVSIPTEVHKTRTSTRVVNKPVTPVNSQVQNKPPVQPKQNTPVQITDNMFTDKQKIELKLAEDEGLKDLIYNPKLSPEQMRVLWMSKSRGSLAEAYRNPAIPVDSMKWYSTNLKHNLDVQDYKFCLAHPELTVEQLDVYKKCISLDMNLEQIGVLSAAELELTFNRQLDSIYANAVTVIPDFISEERINQFKKRR